MTDILESWRDGPAKQTIVDFVTATTTPGPEFVEVADRVATFDNDGTLWVEQPLPPQFDFVFRTWAEEIRQDPSLATQQPYKAIIERDAAFFGAVAAQDPTAIEPLLAAFARTWAGTTPEEFDSQVREWLQTVKQPKLDALYVDLIYKPMRELLGYLRAHEFRVFVCSGGGRDFMRVFAEETWGIYKENVIGTAADYVYTDGRIVRGDHILGALDVGAGKPEHIFAHTGRLPVFAGFKTPAMGLIGWLGFLASLLALLIGFVEPEGSTMGQLGYTLLLVGGIVGLGIWPFIIYAFRKDSWKVYPDESHEHSEEEAGVTDAAPDTKPAN